ncbi:MAG: NAD(+) diphosphatase [Lachnospiraceae bacterium]|nr:NAD(+) diphosphatase [Lachnospiraceae bacterium]
MIQDIGRHRFHNEYHPEARPAADSRILFYHGREIFVKCENDQICFLTFEEVSGAWPDSENEATYLFSIDGISYFIFRDWEESAFAPESVDQTEYVQAGEKHLLDLFPGYAWEKIERMRTVGPKEAAFAGVTGLQLYGWYQSRRFCPACGKHMVHSEKERMMHCPSCGQMEYPKICPAVIVAVTNGDRILLTKYAGRSFRNYALIAGFAEIGETLEETVEREVMEEVGLRVKNIRYYKSQPWSFTDTLLTGFFAEVDRDTHIQMDENELSVAKWCTREEVPEDDGVSLTREMMGVFKSGRQPR